MAARKYINVASTKLTEAVTEGESVTVSHFVILAADGITQKSKPKALAGGTVVLAAGEKMEILDQAFYVENVAGSDINDAFWCGHADQMFLDTDLIGWSTDGSTVTNRIAPTPVTAWDNAAVV